jgi:hypothetical protein
MNVNPFDPAIGIKWPDLPEGMQGYRFFVVDN